MKSKIFNAIFILLLVGSVGQLPAQLSSKLTPSQLTFSDQGNLLSGLTMSIGGLNVQNGFNYSSITDNSISAGGDLQRTISDGSGLTVRNYAAFPASRSNLDLKELTFITSGSGLGGVDQETWTFGITDVGDFDNNDAVQSALSLRYTRVINDIAVFYPLLFVNPEEGNMGMGTYTEDFNAQLYVQEFGQDQIAISGNNTSSSNQQRWGLYGICQGSGTGIRYGVVGQAFTTSGTRYGVLGTADPDFGYAVYASGDMAYTGTLTDVSDRKLKKNISEFSALEKIMRLRPKTYEMRREEFKRMHLAGGKRFGFIAQELQEVFPELVSEQVHAEPYPDGDSLSVEQIDYLGVEYVPMIPILTRAMQEQQVQIEDQEETLARLERDNEQLQRENRVLQDRLDQLEELVKQIQQQTSGGEPTNTVSVSDARLEQNQPNPFGTSTSIPYFIPEGIQSAQLEISDAQGRVLKSVNISARGAGKTILETEFLSGGVYFYSLVLDGKAVDTKKMISVR
ncbi:tail fiber domain-containing protein [Flavilitoribacter nigricans]|uniref:Peptidase S74 domain-containing protein n=1 Tax=Flavilitoribacter nigricans (strain ATCC 23147 / DSM 23189 / NBRC 102662 / NCIMB 1420 / SS-2) TaxID=1122177 RepID=A0A2D0NI72_FLAN2|nr:tail fiber domain-containing protein [Flavilitoribacter nigricans]PHN08205.1 hypothetical protein CRP01_02465 [Flavilitoribacter nigricans DSM 23189 = NBRC 102662]